MGLFRAAANTHTPDVQPAIAAIGIAYPEFAFVGGGTPGQMGFDCSEATGGVLRMNLTLYPREPLVNRLHLRAGRQAQNFARPLRSERAARGVVPFEDAVVGARDSHGKTLLRNLQRLPRSVQAR